MFQKLLINNLLLIAAFSLAALPVSAKVKTIVIGNDSTNTQPTIEVFQTPDQSGRQRYTTLKGSNFPDWNIVNLRVRVKGQCKLGYRLSAVNVRNYNLGSCIEGPFNACGIQPQANIAEPVVVQNVPFTVGNRTLGARDVDFHVPLDYFASLIDYGNEQVAIRAAGSPVAEDTIRAVDWTEYLKQAVGLSIRCAAVVGYTGLDKWWGYDTYSKEVRVVYRGASAEFDLTNPAPGDGGVYNPLLPPNQTFSIPPHVGAHLLALEDDDPDECKLHLSGTFTTNGPMTVFYHLVDNLGEQSPVYKVEVDQTQNAFVHHTVDLGEIEQDGPEPSIDPGFSAKPTDLLQGYYRIEVVSPVAAESDNASYSVKPCTNRPDSIKAIVGGHC